MQELPPQTPLYHAQHSDRYTRQARITEYENLFAARLVVVVDYIGPWSVTYFEDLLYDLTPNDDLHLMLHTLGGDGEVAVRLVRSAQERCRRLTVIVPDRAKSAGTLLAMGANNILMGPTSDLGPVDPQLILSRDGSPHWVAAKDLIAAVNDGLTKVQEKPQAVALLASLLSDVTYLMYQQAQSAIARTDDLVKQALASNPCRSPEQVTELFDKLKGPFIETPTVHGALLGAKEAIGAGLPITEADPSSNQWRRIWRLWVKYFIISSSKGAHIYESQSASQVG